MADAAWPLLAEVSPHHGAVRHGGSWTALLFSVPEPGSAASTCLSLPSSSRDLLPLEAVDTTMTASGAIPHADDHVWPTSLAILLLRGRSYQEIGHRLKMSLNTVRKHVKAVYAKLEAHTARDLVDRYLVKGSLMEEGCEERGGATRPMIVYP